MSYFIDSVIKQYIVSPGEATHFAITNYGKVRYYISTRKNGIKNSYSKKKLADNIASYSKKLEFLMKLLMLIPFGILKFAHMGYYVKIELENEVNKILTTECQSFFKTNIFSWNVIVGNYVKKQKLVFQCFSNDNRKSTIFMKVGGLNSTTEMIAEMNFLENGITYNNFNIPKLLSAHRMSNVNRFNIQVTDKFVGDKVEPVLTNEIYEIFKEIAESREIREIDSVPYAFSHGDFAPWNMKKDGNQFTVFDWEYCSYRFFGYDLIHFTYQVGRTLCNLKPDDSIYNAVELAKEKCVILRNFDTPILSQMYFEEVINAFGHK